MTATLTALQTDLLTRIATRRDAGQHTWGTDIRDIPTRTVTSATKRGLIEATDQGWALTDAGRAAIGRASAPAKPKVSKATERKAEAMHRKLEREAARQAKAELNRCACSEDCEATSRNQFAPGHDARWAGITGRAIAVSAPITADEEYLIRMAYDALPTISEKLAAKAARVALTAIAKAKAKRAA